MKVNTGMEQSNPSMLSDKASFELNLTLKEILGAIVDIIGYIILIISAKQNINEILQSQNRTETPDEPSPAPRTAATATLFFMAASVIFAQVAAARLREREINLQAGITTGSIIPNINMTTGSVLSVLGNILKVIGTQQRASEPTARVTII